MQCVPVKHTVFFLKSSLMNKIITLLCIFVCFFFITIVTNTTLTFASTETSSSAGTVRLNQDHFEVSAASTEMVKVYGFVTSAQRGDKITIIFTMPDGETEGSQVFATEDGLFETFLMLDNNSQLGTYTVFASIRTTPVGSLTFSVVQKQFSIIDNTIPSLPVPKFVEQIILTTDKNSYSDREKIRISGDVRALLLQTPVTLRILSPNGNLVTIAQVQVDVDGTFYTELTAGGPTWSSQGTYTIKVLYGSNARTAETTFYFDGTTITGTVPQTPMPITQPKTTYYDTQMSLQVQDGTNQGYIKVKPALTYGSGSKLSTKDVSIYVDGKYKTKIASNQLSSNIYTGSGSHTIKASVGEMPNTFDNSIRYRASSDIVNYFVKAASIIGSGSSGMGSGVTSSDSFPIEYVIVGIAIAAAAAGIAVALSKRKKAVPVIAPQPAMVPVTPVADDTQFWVCPHCGGDTQYKNGKQFCSSCNVYL